MTMAVDDAINIRVNVKKNNRFLYKSKKISKTMKKNYLKPEIAVYEVMPCEILAGSEKKKSGTTEELGTDEDFNFGTPTSKQE